MRSLPIFSPCSSPLRLLVLCLSLFALALSPLVAAAPPQDKGKNKNNDGSGGSVATQYSGRATAVDITVDTFLLGSTRVVLSDTGQLDTSGGMSEAGLAAASQSGLVNLSAAVLSASTVGSGDLAHSQATVVGLDVSILSLLSISATVLQGTAEVQCTADGAVPVGSANVAGLNINGYDIQISGKPNQQVTIPGLATVIINEQVVGDNSVSVNALRVNLITTSLLSGLVTAEVIISHAEAGIVCGDTHVCPVRDFITGGGQLELTGGRLSFGMVGGLKANGLQGHFNAVDHRSGGPHIRGHELTGYQVVDAVTRELTYRCSGTDSSECRVQAADVATPGKNADSLLVSSGSYIESALLARGNLQLHKPRCSDSGGSEGGGGKGNNGGGKGGKK